MMRLTCAFNWSNIQTLEHLWDKENAQEILKEILYKAAITCFCNPRSCDWLFQKGLTLCEEQWLEIKKVNAKIYEKYCSDV